MFGNHGLGGLLEEGAHEKSPKCLGGNLGDFGEFCKGLLLRLLHNLNRTVIVAVAAVLVVQATVDDVVGVIAVRYGFVTAAFAVNVAFAGIDRMAAVRIGFIDA